MSTLSNTLVVVKSKAARVALDLQLAYACKVAILVAELDPQDLVHLIDFAKKGEIGQVAVTIAIFNFKLV